MQQTADTPCGRIRIGSKIRIDSVDTKTSMFPGGVDTQALELIDQTGTVTHIGGGGASGPFCSGQASAGTPMRRASRYALP